VLHNIAITRRDVYEPLLPGERDFQEEIAALRRRLSRDPDVNPTVRVLPSVGPVTQSSSSSQVDEIASQASNRSIGEPSDAELARLAKEYREEFIDRFFS
jgi:hypothetical protein